MNSRLKVALAFLLAAGIAFPAAASRESWTGSYQCGPTVGDRGNAYSSRITMLIENGEARITRESAAIRESLSGRVATDGTVKLEGTGARKEGGTGWLYRFDGRIDGDRFEARGAMLSPNLTMRLRECSMSLSRVRSSGAAAAPETAVKLKPSIETKPVPKVVAEALTPTISESLATKPRAAPGEPVERDLDFAAKSDTATMEGTVFRGAPHRYLVNARRGQTLNAALKSDGARVDLYEPGSTVTRISGGFVVQGTRVGATDGGDRIDVDLPADGKYLLLVRANVERAFYTLELKLERPSPSAFERWVSDERLWITTVIVLIVLALLFLSRRKRDRRLFKSG